MTQDTSYKTLPHPKKKLASDYPITLFSLRYISIAIVCVSMLFFALIIIEQMFHFIDMHLVKQGIHIVIKSILLIPCLTLTTLSVDFFRMKNIRMALICVGVLLGLIVIIIF